MSPVPRWTRFVDLLTVMLLLVAIIVAASGGFRQHIGSLRFSVTSPWPLLMWAAGLVAVRHAAVRESPIYREYPARLVALMQQPAVAAAARVIGGVWPVMYLVGYLAVFTFGFADGRAPLRHFDNELLNLPVRWDAGWYLAIVTDGYKYTPASPALQQNVVFFPAYPILVRTIGRLLGGHMAGYVVAGTFISLFAFFGALVYLFRFTKRQLDDDRAEGALWLLAAYPFALFFGAVYTESLFLLAVIGCFYHYTRAEFTRAGLWGLLAGLTRANGALLSLLLPLLAITQWLPPRVVSRDAEQTRAWNPQFSIDDRSTIHAAVAALMPVAGVLIYSAFVWKLTGNPLAWLTGHEAWGRTSEGVGALLSQHYSIAAHGGLNTYVASTGFQVLNAIGAVFALLAVWPVARRIGLAYGMFILVNVLPPLGSGGLLSAGRFSSIAFPAFMWLAGAVPRQRRALWMVSFAALQAYNATLFYTWRPLF